MHSWLPFWLKTLGTVYLVESLFLLVMRAIVLMFVPSKSDWTDEFRGIEYRVWGVVLFVAVVAFCATGIACWIMGVRLGRGLPNARQHWRYLAGTLIIMQGLWLLWIVFTGDRLILFHLVQGLLVVALALYPWLRPPLQSG
ncbi:MAG: hypothetical protein KF832_08170 [Caldilineaceae bacterium]|nr:hypothetical protein [Caldilineaceae bacterium]